MRKVLSLAAIVFVTCLYQGGWGATWYVNGSGPEFGDGTSPEKPLETIQEGIDAASDGDTVTVAQGTYVENIQFNGKNIVCVATTRSIQLSWKTQPFTAETLRQS